MENSVVSKPDEQARYRQAKKRVAMLRGFYVHFTVYLLVNALLILVNVLTPRAGLWWQWTALGWGIGLAAHAAVVFIFPSFLGHDWEQRKIREIMSQRHEV